MPPDIADEAIRRAQQIAMDELLRLLRAAEAQRDQLRSALHDVTQYSRPTEAAMHNARRVLRETSDDPS